MLKKNAKRYTFLTNSTKYYKILNILKHYGAGVERLNRKFGKSRSGPATVRWSPTHYVTEIDMRILGRRAG